MTAKRFKIKLSDIGELMDCETKTILAVSDIADELIPLCDLLNELYDENEQLKTDAKYWGQTAEVRLKEIDKLKKQLSDVRKENYGNLDGLNYYQEQNASLSDRISDLECENERLKNKIDVLEDDNETYHKSLEKLNLYTKRFIPTKCINEFKDCKTNRYYWLDHEGNFEGCLELLNLLDCEKEVLKSENRHLKAKLMIYEEQINGDLE